MNDTLFIPCYMAMVIKSLTNLSLKSGTVDCKFTLVIRILKKNIPKNVMTDIEKCILLRINERPFSVSKDYKN